MAGKDFRKNFYSIDQSRLVTDSVVIAQIEASLASEEVVANGWAIIEDVRLGEVFEISC